MPIHILRVAGKTSIEKLAKKLKPCPICGRKAFISHDFVDEFDFGYSVGCPVAKISDGIHGFNDYDSFHVAQLVFLGLYSADQAVKVWNNRCKKGGSHVK